MSLESGGVRESLESGEFWLVAGRGARDEFEL